MEIVLYGHATEVDDLGWRSNTLDVRKRISSIVKKGGLLDAVIDDVSRGGEIDYHVLTRKYLDFEFRCQKILEDLSEEEKNLHLEDLDIEAEFEARYEMLGIPMIERIRLGLFVIDKIRKLEEKKIILDEFEGTAATVERFEMLLNYLQLFHPKLNNIENADTRNNLIEVYNEIESSFSQSSDIEYLKSQHKIIKEVQENLILHFKLIDLMKHMAHKNSEASISEFLQSGIDIAKAQREDFTENIEKIENDYIYNPLIEEFDALGDDLEYLTQGLLR